MPTNGANAAGGGGAGAAAQGLGAAVGFLSDMAAARRRNRILTQGTRQQDRAGMESAAATGDFLSNFKNLRVAPGADRAAFTGALQPPGISGVPGASRAFQADARGAGAGAVGRGRTLADLFARIRAPALQRRAEGAGMVALGDKLRPIQSRAQDDQFLTEMRGGAVRPNPWLQLASGMLQQGGAYASSQGY